MGDGRGLSGGSRDPGTVISFGASKVRNPTDEPLTVTGISLRGSNTQDGVTVTDVYVLDLTGITDTAGLANGFPPPSQATDPFVPAEGAVLSPNTWYQILFVIHVEKPGIWTFSDVEISYEANGEKFVATAPDGLRICAPRTVDCSQ
ncbi:hypothetical protein QEZ54_04330 [Catellatospora sp. KI3]|uniref:hypothetical protein n=1 Tax=Catellatospora sp. KI3 TaxID=3041620 RepID=UPI0024827C75|nr:hypothetical protein [Catellatospora sp. KI3]MDI1460188.1 hypothetical protein [Catellatospora sp. KI3]